MLRDIHLHGALGRRFGRHHRLAVATPAEAVRALCDLPFALAGVADDWLASVLPRNLQPIQEGVPSQSHQRSV